MPGLTAHLKTRPRLFVAALVGVAVALLLPAAPRWTTRALAGWNAAAWLYLALVAQMMLSADHGHVRRVAASQRQGAAAVLGVVVAASLASLAAIGVELASAKAAGGSAGWPHLLFAAVTVVGSWLLLPMTFALDYGSLYYHDRAPAGLAFPGADANFEPDYADFVYVAFTIAVAAQTADVDVTTRAMRRLVTVQSLLSFAFNAAILALTINIAASLF